MFNRFNPLLSPHPRLTFLFRSLVLFACTARNPPLILPPHSIDNKDHATDCYVSNTFSSGAVSKDEGSLSVRPLFHSLDTRCLRGPMVPRRCRRRISSNICRSPRATATSPFSSSGGGQAGGEGCVRPRVMSVGRAVVARVASWSVACAPFLSPRVCVSERALSAAPRPPE